jgi:hypothetical protein
MVEKAEENTCVKQVAGGRWHAITVVFCSADGEAFRTSTASPQGYVYSSSARKTQGIFTSIFGASTLTGSLWI